MVPLRRRSCLQHWFGPTSPWKTVCPDHPCPLKDWRSALAHTVAGLQKLVSGSKCKRWRQFYSAGWTPWMVRREVLSVNRVKISGYNFIHFIKGIGTFATQSKIGRGFCCRQTCTKSEYCFHPELQTYDSLLAMLLAVDNYWKSHLNDTKVLLAFDFFANKVVENLEDLSGKLYWRVDKPNFVWALEHHSHQSQVIVFGNWLGVRVPHGPCSSSLALLLRRAEESLAFFGPIIAAHTRNQPCMVKLHDVIFGRRLMVLGNFENPAQTIKHNHCKIFHGGKTIKPRSKITLSNLPITNQQYNYLAGAVGCS